MLGSKKVAWVIACAAMGVAASSQAALISSLGTGSFSNDSILMAPTGGYAVDFGSTTALTTTGSAAGPTTPVTFEGGPAATTAGINTSSTAAASGIGGNSDLTLTIVNGTSTTKIGSSGSYLSTTTTPTLTTAEAGNGIPDTNFGKIVGTGEYCSGGSLDLDVTLNNLNVGDTYDMQLLLVDGRSSGGVATSGASATIYQDSANTMPIASTPINYTDGVNIGGYIDASFTADAASQDVYVEVYKASGAASGGNIQALILQDTSEVPEPASIGVLAVAAVGMSCRRRRLA
ncbi:MAG TPA: PEP-CTERM sorting domain-containing protein [Tepidisphaeraceae bacterium]|nr:PEP-CTERM sorting domain-containing protein [Tepidisphaeraceae bacterium]